MNEEARKAIEQLGRDAEEVGREHGDHASAKRRKAAAEDALLREVVAAALPALPAIASRVVGLAGPLKRAFALGAFVDTAPLFLGEQGDFFLHVGPQSIVVKTPGEVLDVVPLDAILAPLVAAVRAQVGRAGKKAAEIEREARILEGVALALKVGGAFR